jgi:hypothetical protein
LARDEATPQHDDARARRARRDLQTEGHPFADPVGQGDLAYPPSAGRVHRDEEAVDDGSVHADPKLSTALVSAGHRPGQPQDGSVRRHPVDGDPAASTPTTRGEDEDRLVDGATSEGLVDAGHQAGEAHRPAVEVAALPGVMLPGEEVAGDLAEVDLGTPHRVPMGELEGLRRPSSPGDRPGDDEHQDGGGEGSGTGASPVDRRERPPGGREPVEGSGHQEGQGQAGGEQR